MSDLERRLRQALEMERMRADSPARLARTKDDAMQKIARRNRVYGFAVALALSLVVGLVVAVPRLVSDPDSRPVGPLKSPSPSVDEERSEDPNCMDLSFEPTYLPDGFSYVLEEGDGGQIGIPLDEQNPRAYGHYSGEREFISIYSQGSYYVLSSVEQRLGMFGGRIEGRVGPVEDGYAVEFRVRSCEYSAIGFGITEAEMAAFARGLILEDGPVARNAGFAVWPETSPADAIKGCRAAHDGPAEWRKTPDKVVDLFSSNVLGIVQPLVTRGEKGFEVASEGRPVAHVNVAEVAFDCWSVVGAGPPTEDSPRIESFSWRNGNFEFGYAWSGVPRSERRVEADLYVGRTSPSGSVWDPPGPGLLSLDVPSEPTKPGAYVLKFVDPSGRLVGVSAGPLPVGATAAG